MKKVNVALPKPAEYDVEAVIGIIETQLFELLTLHCATNFSDLHYVKVYITRNISIIIKMLAPFKTSPSYIIYAYLNNEAEEKQTVIFSSAIQNLPDMIGTELKQVSTCIATIITDMLKYYPTVHNLVMVTNLDSDSISQQRGFKELKVSQNPEEAITDFIYWIGQNMDKHKNFVMVRLSLVIYPNTEDEIKGVYELIIECSEIFNELKYSVLFGYPYHREPIIGLPFDELADGLYSELMYLLHIKNTVCIKDDIGKINYYIQKQEVNS